MNCVKILAVLTAGGLALSQAHAASVAFWNFDAGAQNNTNFSGAAPYGANTYVAAKLSKAGLEALTASTGAAEAAVVGNSGLALGFTTPGTGQPASVAGSSFQFQLTAGNPFMIGSINLDYLDNKAAGAVLTLSYQINGGPVVTGPSLTLTADDAWHTNISESIAALTLSTSDTVVFTASLSGAGSTHNEHVAFDNLSVNSIPEPGALAVGALGLLLTAATARRHPTNRGRIFISPP